MCTFDSPIASILNLPVVATCLVLTSIPAIAALQVHVEHLRLRVSALYKWSEIERVRRVSTMTYAFLAFIAFIAFLGAAAAAFAAFLAILLSTGKE